MFSANQSITIQEIKIINKKTDEVEIITTDEEED